MILTLEKNLMDILLPYKKGNHKNMFTIKYNSRYKEKNISITIHKNVIDNYMPINIYIHEYNWSDCFYKASKKLKELSNNLKEGKDEYYIRKRMEQVRVESI